MSTTQTSSLLLQANSIASSFHADVRALLKDNSITSAEADTINSYLTAVTVISNTNSYKKMKEENSKEHHCVRCHDEFTNDFNGPDACVIPHVFDGDDYQRWGGDSLMYSSESKCCGGAVTVLEENPGNSDFQDMDRIGKCSVDWHTTEVEEVEYDDINIRACELKDGECVTRFLGDRDPVFIC